MKTALTGLAALSLVLGTAPAWSQHSHDNGDTHAHEQDHGHSHDDDHGHAHDDGGHDHHDEAPEGLQLAVEANGSVAPGTPVSLSLALSAPDGTAITADDLVANHGHKLHVMIIDEGLDDFHHLHVDADANGVFQVDFTPQYARIYRVWADTVLAEPLPEAEAEGHGHPHEDEHARAHTDGEAHDHGEGHDHGDGHAEGHDDHHGRDNGGDHDESHHGHDGAETATAWIAVGDEAAPYIAPIETLESEAAGYRFTLAFDDHIHSGESMPMQLTVSDAGGNAVTSLEPVLGAFAHLVGFNPGASAMVHAHPGGAEPQSASERGGPTLNFDVMIENPGVHRLFAHFRIGGEDITTSFTVVAE